MARARQSSVAHALTETRLDHRRNGSGTDAGKKRHKPQPAFEKNATQIEELCSKAQVTILEDQAYKEGKVAVDGTRQAHPHAKERKAEKIGYASNPTARAHSGRRTPPGAQDRPRPGRRPPLDKGRSRGRGQHS